MIDTAGQTTARILVVDDEQSITDLVAMALRYEHFACRWRTAATRRSTQWRRSPPTSSSSIS